MKMSRCISKTVSCLLCMLLLLCALPPQAAQAALYDEEKVLSPYAAVYNVENGTFIFEKDADVYISAASAAKIMTAVLVLEHFASLEAKFTVPYSATQGLSGATIFGLYAGEELTLRDLLYTMYVGNCNDSANALALAMCEKIQDFTAKMNAKAAEIGLSDTVFKNPTGLSAQGAHTTVKDTVLLCAYASRVTGFTTLANTVRYTVPPTNKHTEEKTVYTKNYFLSSQTVPYHRWDAAGGMSANNTDTGYSLVSSYSAYSLSYICMCAGEEAGATKDLYSYSDVKRLLLWAAEEYTTLKVLDVSKIFGELPVSLSSDSEHIVVVPKESLYAFLPKDTDINTQITEEFEITVTELTAPVEKGEVVGRVRLLLGGKEIASCDLVTKFPAKKSEWLALRSALFSAPMLLGLGGVFIAACIFGTARFFLFISLAKKSPSQRGSDKQN